MLFFYRDMHNEKYPISPTNRPTPPTFCNTQRMGFFFEEKWFLAPKFEIPGKIFPLYWFRNLGWLIYKSALCTGIALLPRWGPKSHKCVQRLHELTISTKNRVSKWVYCWNFENQPFLIGVNDLIQHTSGDNSADELWDHPCVWIRVWLFGW